MWILHIPEARLWIAMFELLLSLYLTSAESWRNWLIPVGPARSRVPPALLLAISICTWAWVGRHVTLTKAPAGSRNAGGCCHAPWETRCCGCSGQAEHPAEIAASTSRITAGFYQVQNAKPALGTKKLNWLLHVLSECYNKWLRSHSSPVPFWFISTMDLAVQPAITGGQEYRYRACFQLEMTII